MQELSRRYFVIAEAVLVGLFYLEERATLGKGASPVVTSDRVNLLKSWHPDPVQTLVRPPAPEPDMTSPAVAHSQPKADPPKTKHVTRRQLPDDRYRQSQAWSRDRDRGPFGFFFGRF